MADAEDDELDDDRARSVGEREAIPSEGESDLGTPPVRGGEPEGADEPGTPEELPRDGAVDETPPGPHDGDGEEGDDAGDLEGAVADNSDDATREVDVDATALTHGRASETRVARRREETVVRGETTLLEDRPGDAATGAPAEGAPRRDGESLESQRTQPEGDPLDAVEDPYAHLPFVASQPAAPVPPPARERGAARTPALIFVAIAAVVVAAVLGAFVTWRLELWGGTTVPDVMGLSEAQATVELSDAGFEVAVRQVVVDEGVDTVVSMQPQAGRRVATGRTVEISIGVDRVVPDVEGLDLDEARAEMDESGIDHLRLEYQNSSAPKGTITSVSPVAGTKVAADEVVTLVVAQPYTVPDVIGLTADAARAALDRAGLGARVDYVPSDTVDPGRVVSTDPVAGTEMDEGAVVALGVSSPYPASLFDLSGYLTAKPEDVSTYLTDQGYGVSYGRDEDGVADMTWEPRGGAGRGMPAVGFTALPFSLPSGFQLFPQDALRQGARIEGVYLQVGEAAGRWDVGSLLGLMGDGGPGSPADAGGAAGSTSADGSPGTSIDSRAAGGDEGSIDLEVSQDCVTRLMNLCGLRSTPDTTSTATQESVDAALGRKVELAAKAGAMDGLTWYVVVWRPTGSGTGSSGDVRVSMGMAPTEGLRSALAAAGVDVASSGDSMAGLAASLVLAGGVVD